MMRNFANIIKAKNIENEQFYGLFGLFHVSQNGVNGDNFQPLAARLKTNGFKVTSIVCVYVDSQVYLPKNKEIPTPPSEKIGFLNMDGPIVLIKGINDLKKASNKKEVTLFSLNKPNSPYYDSKKLITMKTNFINQIIVPYDENLSTVDFFQYVIMIRNSKALTPIANNLIQ